MTPHTLSPPIDDGAGLAAVNEPPPGWPDRLLTEAVRALEESRGSALAEPAADLRAIQAGGDFETRVIIRARHLSVAEPLRQALHRVRRRMVWGVGLAVLLAFLMGLGTGRVLLGLPGPAPVNIAWLLGGLLGPPSLALLLWLMLLFLPGSALGGLLAGGVAAAVRTVSLRVGRDQWMVAAMEAFFRLGGRGSVGRWSLSALSHALWAAFLLGGLAMGVLVLSLWQFEFAWETTLLTERQILLVLGALADPLAGLGIAVPDVEAMRSSRAGSENLGAIRGAWASWLMAALAVYGLVPRVLLFALSLGLGALARRHRRLDLSALAYERLHERLMVPGRGEGIVDPDPGLMDPRPVASGVAEGPPLSGDGPVALLSVEMEPPREHWPPDLPGVGWRDLGMVDSRVERQRVLQSLSTLTPPPRALVAVYSLLSTPDRGVGLFIGQLVAAAPCPVLLLLSDGAALRRRGDPGQRLEDWRRTAGGAGLPTNHLLELDLSGPADIIRGDLSRFLGLKEETPP